MIQRLNKHLALIPVFSRQRKFHDGIQFSQWTGDHTRAALKLLPAALFNLEGVAQHGGRAGLMDEVVEMFVLLNKLVMYASSLVSTDEDRRDQTRTYRRLLVIIRMKETFDFREKLNWPRLHAVQHYSDWTLLHGVPSHSDTSTGESAHIKTVKEHYRASNKCEPTLQIINGNTRYKLLQSLRFVLESVGAVQPEHPVPPLVYPAHCVVMAERGTGNGRRMLTLHAMQELTGFKWLCWRMEIFMNKYYTPRRYRGSVGDLQCHLYNSIHVSFPEYARSPVLTPDNCRTLSYQIYCNPTYTHRGAGGGVKSARGDVVLVRSDGANPQGKRLQDYMLVQLGALFSIQVNGHRLELAAGYVYDVQDGDEVEDGDGWAYRQPRARLAYKEDYPILEIFEIKHIFRPVHLQPLFENVPFNETHAGIRFTNVLDEWRGFFAVGLFSDQHVFRHFGKYSR